MSQGSGQLQGDVELVKNGEVEMVIDNYFNGLSIINNIQVVGSSFFSEAGEEDAGKLRDLIYGLAKKTGKQSYLRNPDLFYSILQHGVMNEYQGCLDSLLKFNELDPRYFTQETLKDSFVADTAADAIGEKLKSSLELMMDNDDEQLKVKAGEKFSVDNISLVSSKRQKK